MITRDLEMVKVEGDLQGDVIEMSIDETAYHLIMERLIRLYNDPILAFVREISTNAFDATIAAVSGAQRAAVLDGSAGKPIEVTLPAKLAPMFIVRDHGTGMSYEDIVNVYSKYGASTKRTSNDFNGALGFGCKAPLAYTPSFSVSTVKNGLRNVVQVGRNAKGGGAMTIAEKDAPTTEPNGTTVLVPVKEDDVQQVIDTARDFFRYWKPGTVTVNGEQPEVITPTLRLSDTISVIEDDTDRIVMANVAYPTPGRLATGLRHGYAAIIEVPTGEVEFTPSREGLEATDFTRRRLAQAAQDFKAATKGAIQRKIDEATTPAEAVAAMVKWHATLPSEARTADDTYRFGGAILPASWQPTQRMPGQDWPFLKADLRDHAGSRHSGSDIVQAREFATSVFVTGFKAGKFTLNHRRRIGLWVSDMRSKGHTMPEGGYGFGGYLTMCRLDAIPADIKPWIPAERIVTWEHIKANYKLPTKTSTGGTIGGYKTLKGSYDHVCIDGGWVSEVLAKDIRTNVPLYYYQTREGYSARRHIELLPVIHKAYTVVQLPANRVEKFKRDFPAAKHVNTCGQDAYKAWLPTVTATHKRALAAQEAAGSYGSGLSGLRELDPARVDDPALKEAIHLLKMDLNEMRERDRVFSQIVGKRITCPAFVDPMQRYPLVPHRTPAANSKARDHLYLYINAAYAAGA